MPSTHAPDLRPAWVALTAFALLTKGHFGEEDLLLETKADGQVRHAAIHLSGEECPKALAEVLGPALDPGVASFAISGGSAEDGERLTGRIQLADQGASLDLLSAFETWGPTHFKRLVDTIVSTPGVPCQDLSMLAPEERALLIGRYSGPPHDPDLTRDETLPRLFEATAREWPDRAALDVDGQSQTYADLEAEANRLAHLLLSQGLGPGSRVGHWFPRGAKAHAALLGILKTGAAYVPLDPDLPPARVQQVAVECGMNLLMTPLSWRSDLDLPCPTLNPMTEDVAQFPPTAPTHTLRPDDLAYVIFTSGSTGTPKGVPISHRSACTLVRAEQRLFGVGPEDRVFQGFSLAFDASVEELWLAWASGACLVVGTQAMMQSGPDLGRRLNEVGVTVLSTVPTLLGFLGDPIPSLRLLILGGEACPADLVKHWWRPGLRMVNTYGPTEATVISTWTDLLPDRPVTIGRAVPNDRVYVLDAGGGLCPIGVPGELHLSGVGLSQGYLGRPDLTAERFITNPYADGPFTQRLYRTGDRVRFNDAGDLEFLGRIDTQVKLRGFRIELEEVEASLRLDPTVLAAAVALWKEGGPERLVAYVVPRPGAALDEEGLLHGLRNRLPSYMVPSGIESLEHLPTLSSGKLDRKRLPAPRRREWTAPAHKDLSPNQQRLMDCWTRLFHGRVPDLDENFFKDLGGHSLLAAAMVSELRKEPAFAGLAVPDVYAFPTLRALAAECEARSAHQASAFAPAPEGSHPVSPWRHRFCALAQTFSLYPLLGFYALQWLSPYLVYSWSQDHDIPRQTGILAALASLVLVYPAMYALSIAAKWILLGRIRPGRHALWGFYYWRWWLTHRIIAAAPLDYLVETPWLSFYFRLMGAQVGRDVHLGTTSLAAFDLIAIGDDSSIGQDARLSGYTLEDGYLVIGPIHIGRRCYVGNRAILSPGVVLEDGAQLEDLSLLPAHGRIATGQHWIGSPARPLPPTETDRQRLTLTLSKPSPLQRFAFGTLQALGAFLIPVAFLAAIFPGLIFINELYASTSGYFAYLVVAPAVALSFVVLLALEIAAAKWVLLGRVRPGTYDRHGGFILRKWFVDRLMSLGLDLLAPLYATLYLAPWFRLLGARLGAWAEVSTAGSGSPDLLDIGEESFIADCVSFGPPRVDLGQVTLASTRVGRRAFVGNSALIPSGTTLGDSVLVGVLSVPPLDPLEAARVDSAWLGSPAIYLPHRQESASFGEEATFRPPKRMILLRAFIEQFRVIAPATGFVIITSLLLTAMTEIEEASSLGTAVLALPLLYFVGGLLACLFVVAVKWLVIGVYHPSEKPLWCSFIWRTELVSSLHENLADSWLLRLLVGTPFVPAYFRLLGCKIGRRACMESTWLTEYDLVKIGDEAQLNADCTVQTHLFEDRVMKMDRIDIGAGCSVGTDSVVLYGSRMEAGSVLGDLSLLMKGETLPPGTRWEGSPARPSQRLTPPSPSPRPASEDPNLPVVHLHLDSEAQPLVLPVEPGRECHFLDPDPHDRPRALDAEGRTLSISVSRSAGARMLAWTRHGRLGVDMEPFEPSSPLQAAVELLLSGEQAWAEGFPAPHRWKAYLSLWTAKEAVLKALGQGFALGMDQVELGPDGRGGIKLLRLFGSASLAQGWHLEHQERTLGAQRFLVALAVAAPSQITVAG